jgi:hypothetical protein
VPAGNPSAFMADGAWGSSDPPVIDNCLSRFGTRTVRHLFAVALLSTATEADAMNESDTFTSYTVVEPINDDTPLPDLNSLLGILKRMRGCEGADGHPWPETDVSPGRRVSLARSERAMVGALTVLELLHAADRCRVAAEPERHLDEGVVDGLFLACRGLVEWACREIRPD